MVHLFLPGFRVTSLVQSSFLAKYELDCKCKSFCNCIFLPKRGWKLIYTHVILDELRKYLCILDELLGGVYVILCNYSCQPVGGGIGQCPATEVTYLGLNQPPVFSSDS